MRGEGNTYIERQRRTNERRRVPSRNVPAVQVLRFLDRHATMEKDPDSTTRRYINGIWVDDVTKREIRRYRHHHVKTLRPETLNRLLVKFNLEEAWQARP